MARKKKTTNKEEQGNQKLLTAELAKEIYEKSKKRKEVESIPVVKVEMSYESDKLEPTADVLMNTEIIVKTAKQIALEEFANFWNALPHHQYISDKEARYVHTLWQTATGRTDYYSNCSICTINHIKQLKKLCKNEGIELKK